MTPDRNRFYQHRYGGIYSVDKVKAKSSADKSEWVVYTHIWPFEEEVWIRPYSEWIDGRFRLLEQNEYLDLIRRDREEFQREITANKEAANKDK